MGALMMIKRVALVYLNENACMRLVQIASRDVDKYALLPVNSSRGQQWNELLTARAGNSEVIK